MNEQVARKTLEFLDKATLHINGSELPNLIVVYQTLSQIAYPQPIQTPPQPSAE